MKTRKHCAVPYEEETPHICTGLGDSIAPFTDTQIIMEGVEATMRCKMFCNGNPSLRDHYAVLAQRLEAVAMRLEQ